MRKKLLITTAILFFIGLTAMPSFALSSLAEDFLRACRSIDSEFPPPDWDRYELRDAALEVLDEIDAGLYDPWPVDFCLQALGHTEFHEDIDRILAYEEKMTYSVLISLRGFQHTKAVNLFIRYLDNSKSPKRECAVRGLAQVDFDKFKNPAELKSHVLATLNNARQKEKVDWLIDVMDKSIAQVESFRIKKAPQK